MAAIRVAVDMTFPNRNPAGSGVYATELVDHLRRAPEVDVAEVAATGRGLANTLRWLTGGARRAAKASHVLHCPAFVAPWNPGVPMVLTVHDTSTLRFPEDHPLEWRAYARYVLPGRARAASRVITGTEFSKSEIVRDLGVEAARVVVTPYGVARRFAEAHRNPHEPSAPPLLLFAGAPTRRKNLELVLAAMADGRDGSALRRARLVITGATAGEFPHHVARIRSLGLADRIEWRGKVAAVDMPDVMARADLLLYPSLYEGFGFPALEAMLARTPVVASNAACLPEVLGDGAVLIDPHDVKALVEAADAVLQRADVRDALVERGQTWVKRYSWSRCAEQTVEVYRLAAQ